MNRAIKRFNGQPLRPFDPRCPRLLCRVRKKDDDLRAGVGAQRGQGMHMKWIREQKGKEKKADKSEPSQSDFEEPSTPSSSWTKSSASGDDEGEGRAVLKGRGDSSGSGSYASTNSSILTKYFPKRYFILKSLTQVCVSSLFIRI